MINLADSKWSERKDEHLESKSYTQEERLQKWKKYFKNIHMNSLEITDKPIQKLSMVY